MPERLAEFVFLPDPGPSVLAAWAARILFPPAPLRGEFRDLRFNGVPNRERDR